MVQMKICVQWLEALQPHCRLSDHFNVAVRACQGISKLCKNAVFIEHS